MSSFFPHLSADASRDFSSGSSLFLSALHSLASALPPFSGPPVFPPLSTPLPSAPAPLHPQSFPSAFLLPLASTPLPSAPPLGFSTPSVRPPRGFPSGFSAFPSASVPSFLPSVVPSAAFPSSFSAPSSLSAILSAPGFDSSPGVAAPAVPDAAPAVPAAALSLFCPFAMSVFAEAPVASSALSVFASAPPVASAGRHPGFPSGVPPVPPHYSAPSASHAPLPRPLLLRLRMTSSILVALTLFFGNRMFRSPMRFRILSVRRSGLCTHILWICSLRLRVPLR